MKGKCKRILSFMLSFIMVLALLPTGTVVMATDMVSADGAEGGYGIIVGGVEITSDNPEVNNTDAPDVISSGSAVYDPDTKTLTLNGLTVDMTNGVAGAAIRVCEGTHITINLEGENTLTSSPGYAGIAVEAGWDDAGNFSEEASAQVTIGGDGSMEVYGGNSVEGDFGAGAGIGGDGFGEVDGHREGGDFGCITINGGTIEAYGGACADINNSGGAGIGGGGVYNKRSSYELVWTYAGSITIEGGTVTATGGITVNPNWSKGGAGIGTGSPGNNYADSDMTVTISGGTVIATGGTDGAGIGGGSNVISGSIEIGGTANVTAKGGDEGAGGFGGAGIGGGDNGSSGPIEIGGKSRVEATAGGAAAGIGGGGYGIATDISITGEAVVKAYGGSGYGNLTNYKHGGAGIGSGRQSFYADSPDTGKGTILLNSSGSILAVAGYGAQAVGIDTAFKENVHSYKLTIGTETNELWMINQDTAQPAFWGQNEFGTGVTNDLSVNGCIIVWHTGSALASDGQAYAFDGTEVKQYDWTYADGTLKLLQEGSEIKSVNYPGTSDGTLGNWAVVVDSLSAPLTDIVWVGGQGMTASEDGEVVSYYTNGADGAAGMVSQAQPDEYNAKLYYDTAAEAYTLELNDLNATGIANDADSYGAGIYSTVPLVVNVSGYNSVSGAAGTGDVYGVYSKELTINGTENDTLYITTQDSTSDNYGIYSEGNVIINDVVANITVGKARTGSASPDTYNVGIYVVGKLVFNDAEVTATAGNSAGQSAGIFVKAPISLYYVGGGSTEGGAGTEITPGDSNGTTTEEGGITINGGKVTATAGVGYGSGQSTAFSDGIYADGAITVNGDATVVATSNYGTQGSYGMESYNSDININGGTVTASVKFENIGAGIDTRNCLNFGISAGNNLNITDGELNAYSEENGLNTNYAVYVKKDLTISGGSLTAIGAPAGTFSYGINCNNLTIKDGAQVTAASDTAGYLSYGTFVYGNFHMSDNNSALTTSSGVVESNTSWYVNRSAGLYLGDDRYEDNFITDDTFTITGGTLKAWCDSSDSQNATEAVAVGLLDVVDDKFVFSDANQSNDKWYEWTLQSDENGDPVNKIMSTDKVYVHNDADENCKSPYLYIAPMVIKHTVTYDLDGGTGADGVDYSTQTVADGTEITVKEAPTKSGYTFNGYSDGTSTYNPGDKIIVNADITLTARWTQNSQPGGGGSTPRGNVALTKVDANDSSTLISNVEFKLYRANGTLVGTYTTDENGKITVNRLQTGKYYWQETRPAEGYTLDAKKYEFEIVRNKTTEITVTNSRSSVPGVFRDEHYAYVVGYPDGLVRPEANITRAEVATIFFRLLNDETRAQYMTKDNSFSDVKADAWYNTAVSTMAKMGIVEGYPDGEFKPDENITRAEFAAIAARFDEKSAGTDNASFADIVNHWAENEINKAVSNGWVLGYEDGTFRPEKSITRAETMTLVNRVLQRIPEGKEDLLAGMIEWPDNADENAWYYLAVQEATSSHEYSRKASGYEKWTEVTEAFDWAALEK